MKRNLKVAVLSGKGGTGKTLISVNLAAAAEESLYIDCDVEEPNGHLFFKPVYDYEHQIMVKIPVAAAVDRCTQCRTCVDFCKFNAIAMVNGKPVIFPEVCHSCGGCILFCPEDVFAEESRAVGKIKSGASGNVTVLSGILNLGETSGTAIIEELLHIGKTYQDHPVFIDCPPGSACTVMESIRDADYCILVAEPTVYGAHNLNMVYELVQLFHKPHGVVLNKCLAEENPAESFCREKGIPILWKIPYDPKLGKMNGDGRICARESQKYRDMFTALLDSLMRKVAYETVTHS